MEDLKLFKTQTEYNAWASGQSYKYNSVSYITDDDIIEWDKRVITRYFITASTSVTLMSEAGVATFSGQEIDGASTSVTSAYTFSEIGEHVSKSVLIDSTSIGNGAFSGCSLMTTAYIPQTVTSIGDGAFKNCTILSCTCLPSGLTNIGASAFEGCTSIAGISIPRSVSSIGENAFSGCTSLATINFNGTVAQWNEVTQGNGWHDGVPTNEVICLDGTVMLIQPKTLTYYATAKLPEVNNPGNGLYTGGFGNGRNILSHTFENGVGSIEVDGEVTSLYCTFKGCTALTGVEIPETVTEIYNGTFNGCSALTNIDIPDSVTKLGQNDYSNGYYGGVFSNCYSLTELTIPSGVTQLGPEFAKGCSSLTAVICEANTPPTMCYLESLTGNYSYNQFDNTNNCLIFVPCGTEQTYKTAAHWSDYSTRISGLCNNVIRYTAYEKLPEVEVTGTTTSAVTGLHANAFYPSNIVAHTFNNGEGMIICDTAVTRVYSYGLYNCTGLTGIELPDSITTINGSAFSICSSLPGITFPSGLTTLGSNAFASCTSLTSVTMPNSVTSARTEVFMSCTSLESITFSSGLTLIESGICYNCTSLTSVTIPSSVTTIGLGIIAYTSSERVMHGSFGNCTSLSSITIPDSVRMIGGFTFDGCTSLTSVTIPSSVKNMRGHCFYGCSSLTSITMESVVPPTLQPFYRNPAFPSETLYTDFFTDTNNCPIYVPCGSAETYKQTTGVDCTGWIPYASRITSRCLEGPLTFVVYDGDMRFKYNTTTASETLSYSLDSGATWTTLANNTYTPVLHDGNTIMWKGNASSANTFSSSGTTNAKFNAEGNVMSILYGDNYQSATSMTGKTLEGLFYNCNKLVDASDLVLPATTLTDACYEEMFEGCTSLTMAPELPATTLADDCYHAMFYNCISLTTAPVLSATTLAYQCYYGMFSYCHSLTTAPSLPATRLEYGCYTNMFIGCTSLTTAPSLPATTLAGACYAQMFQHCTSLTTAPALPATTLAYYCYNQMFSGCTSLNYIKCLATDISANGCTGGWVSNVAASGTFVKAGSMTRWTTDVNGIPSGWTVQNAS